MRWLWLTLCLMGMVGQTTDAPTSFGRSSGVESSSGIAYALISMGGERLGDSSGPRPRLTAQCTRTPAGKLKFELLADFGSVTPIVYEPPWTPKAGELFAPNPDKVQVTMEFLGYTKVKPVKRQWDVLAGMPDELRYAAPGKDSRNMEEVSSYLQYLRSLPTLRLTVQGKGVAEWETAKWQQAVHAEALCGASGL